MPYARETAPHIWRHLPMRQDARRSGKDTRLQTREEACSRETANHNRNREYPHTAGFWQFTTSSDQLLHGASQNQPICPSLQGDGLEDWIYGPIHMAKMIARVNRGRLNRQWQRLPCSPVEATPRSSPALPHVWRSQLSSRAADEAGRGCVIAEDPRTPNTHLAPLE